MPVGCERFEFSKWATQRQKGEAAEYAEAGVYASPVKRDAADRACDEGEEWNGGAGDEAPGDEPLVADGVYPWADEGGSDDEVREGEPVRSISEEGVACVGVGKRGGDADEPCVELRGV